MPHVIISRLGIDGRACVLRAICDAADTTLQHNGLAGEVLHVLLTWVSDDNKMKPSLCKRRKHTGESNKAPRLHHFSNRQKWAVSSCHGRYNFGETSLGIKWIRGLLASTVCLESSKQWKISCLLRNFSHVFSSHCTVNRIRVSCKQVSVTGV